MTEYDGNKHKKEGLPADTVKAKSKRDVHDEFCECHNCTFIYDITLEQCPKCGEKNEKRR
jgi:hypothetical protein